MGFAVFGSDLACDDKNKPLTSSDAKLARSGSSNRRKAVDAY